MGFFFKKTILLLTVFLWANYAFAQNHCLQLFKKSGEQTFDRFTSKIDQWNELLQEHAVPDIRIMLEPVSFLHSSFDMINHRIHLGLLNPSSQKDAREIALSHEFGHAVFSQHFAIKTGDANISVKEISEQARQKQIQLQQNSEYIKISLEMQDIEGTLQLAIATRQQKLADDLAALLLSKRHHLESFIEESKQFNFLHSALIPYNELFADALAAIFWQRSDIMTTIINVDEMTYMESIRFHLRYRLNNKVSSKSRDFTINPFKNWQHEYNNEYTALDPARGILWNLYMKNLKQEEIPLFVTVFFEAVSKHVNQRSDNKESLILEPTIDLGQFNRDFVRHFVVAAKKHGLTIKKKMTS